MTRHEFNTFKNVLAQGANAETALAEASAARKIQPDSTGRAQGIVRQEDEFPALLRPLAEEAETISAERAKELALHAEEVMKEKAQTARCRANIAKAMDAATTDLELWEIFQTRILAAVKAALEKNEGEVGVTALTTTLPQLLIHMGGNLRKYFPGSGFSLALLPTLKKMGPAAFAMGATTELYNMHMRVMVDRYWYLDWVAEVLWEMDQEVYEFDEGTREHWNCGWVQERVRSMRVRCPGDET
jgi:hypothetical protein